MTPSTSANAFEEFVEAGGGGLPDLNVRTGLGQMLAFYVAVLPTGCTNESGDMLLFQWGTCDWGNGRRFEINIARQFIESAAEDDDAISQLQLTFRFPPDRNRDSLGAGNRWCKSQSEVNAFRQFILAHAAFRAEADSISLSISLHHDYV